LLFVAMKSNVSRPTERWRPYVRGNIKLHPINSFHDDMLDLESAAQIGHALSCELGSQARPRPKRFK